MDFIKNAFGYGKRPEDKPHNFPPFCSFMYHNISEECQGQQLLCYCGWGELIALNVIVFANFVGSILGLAVQGIDAPGIFGRMYVGLVALATVYQIFIPIASFYFQYWPLYAAARDKSKWRYIYAIVWWVFGVIYNILMAAGLPMLGGCGIFTGVDIAIGHSSNPSVFRTVVTIWHFVQAVAWILNALFMIGMVVWLIRNYKLYGGTGSSSGDVKSQVVGRVVSQVVSNALS